VPLKLLLQYEKSGREEYVKIEKKAIGMDRDIFKILLELVQAELK